MGKKIFKITLWTIISLILLVVLILGGYLIYLSAQYYRIEDNQVLEVSNASENLVSLNTNYTISTYNIGFGAYTHDFSFFMDSGEMLDGTKTQGTGSKAKDKETVLTNTNGAISVASELDADFMFFQEVDVKATRSYKVNQFEMLKESFSNYSNTFAYNFHSAFLFYPILDPHGATDAGIATFSKYKIDSSIRRSFPIDEGFFAKFFDLDRCFSVNRLKINGSDKELVLINLHMSAYDKGGLIRAEQLSLLNSVLKEERDKGNYVVAGGDFNHDIADSIGKFETQEKKPEWTYSLSANQLTDGYSFATANNVPTCRSTDIAYTKGVNYTVVLDGFIVSDNVEVIEVENIDNDFMYSDHNPAKCVFKLI